MSRAGFLSAAAVAISMAGCATSPTPPVTAIHVAQSKIFAFGQMSLDKAAVIFVRDSGFTGSGCDVLLSVDDTPAAQLAAGELVQLHVEPGEHIFGVRYTGAGLCGLDKNVGTQREFTLSVEHPKMFRVQLSPAIDILPMTSGQANAQPQD